MEVLLDLVRDPRTGAAVILGGVCVVLYRIWIDEREERRRLQDENGELRERVITAMNAATVAINSTRECVSSLLIAVDGLKDIVMMGRRRDEQ